MSEGNPKVRPISALQRVANRDIQELSKLFQGRDFAYRLFDEETGEQISSPPPGGPGEALDHSAESASPEGPVALDEPVPDPLEAASEESPLEATVAEPWAEEHSRLEPYEEATDIADAGQALPAGEPEPASEPPSPPSSRPLERPTLASSTHREDDRADVESEYGLDTELKKETSTAAGTSKVRQKILDALATPPDERRFRRSTVSVDLRDDAGPDESLQHRVEDLLVEEEPGGVPRQTADEAREPGPRADASVPPPFSAASQDVEPSARSVAERLEPAGPVSAGSSSLGRTAFELMREKVVTDRPGSRGIGRGKPQPKNGDRPSREVIRGILERSNPRLPSESVAAGAVVRALFGRFPAR